jgi:hypothetical protein
MFSEKLVGDLTCVCHREESLCKYEDITVQDVKFCHPDYNLAQVSEIIWKGGSGAPGCERIGTAVNMITDRDICIALGTTNPRPSDVLGVCYTMRRFAQGSMNSARPFCSAGCSSGRLRVERGEGNVRVLSHFHWDYYSGLGQTKRGSRPIPSRPDFDLVCCARLPISQHRPGPCLRHASARAARRSPDINRPSGRVF